MANPRHALGLWAEASVAAWLVARGWTILARRWRCPAGELDLVARDPDQVIVAVEVKVRRTGRAGSGIDSVDRRRVVRLRAALGSFVAGSGHPAHQGIPIDLVSLQLGGDGRWRLSHHPGIDAW